MPRRLQLEPKPGPINLRDVIVGARPGMGTPSFRERPPLPLRELDVSKCPPLPGDTPTTGYWLGECTVIVSHNLRKWWHLSIAHPSRYPHWDEIAEARYRLLPPGLIMAIVLPAESEWVNIHKNCFQLVELAPGATYQERVQE